jgi:hypothetical protein
MDELMDMIIADESPSNISDRIKEILFAKTSDRVDGLRPHIANDLFGDPIEDEEEIIDEE